MTDIAERIARLNQRASEAVEKAKSGRTRIKGDGDGDGIPYEGRGKKGGAGPRASLSPAQIAMSHQILAGLKRTKADLDNRYFVQDGIYRMNQHKNGTAAFHAGKKRKELGIKLRRTERRIREIEDELGINGGS